MIGDKDPDTPAEQEEWRFAPNSLSALSAGRWFALHAYEGPWLLRWCGYSSARRR